MINVLKEQWMFIDVLLNLKSSVAKVYLLNLKDKAVINWEFNKFYKQKKWNEWIKLLNMTFLSLSFEKLLKKTVKMYRKAV